MNGKNFFFVLLLVLCGGIACKAQNRKGISAIKPDARHVILLLDSTAAAAAISTDHTDGFFEKVRKTEMSIQMKTPLEPGQTRIQQLGYYMSFLREDVADFTAEEARFVENVMEKVFKTVQSVSPSIMPDTLKLIKTRGRHYGDGVWYTRENCIIIPADELDRKKTNPFSNTMYHEIFHVYSRLNPAKSAELYRLIGFEAVGYDNLVLPESLAERVFYNPDGVDFAQKINLAQEDGTTIAAFPIIYTGKDGYQDGQDVFFSYVEFSLYKAEKKDDGKWHVIVREDGISSTLDMNKQPDFFRQIKDNTGYIIHPDEVLADNFSFIMQEKTGAKVTMKFSREGKALIADIEALLKR